MPEQRRTMEGVELLAGCVSLLLSRDTEYEFACGQISKYS